MRLLKNETEKGCERNNADSEKERGVVQEFAAEYNERNPTANLDLVLFSEKKSKPSQLQLWDGNKKGGLKVHAKFEMAHGDATRPSELSRVFKCSRAHARQTLASVALAWIWLQQALLEHLTKLYTDHPEAGVNVFMDWLKLDETLQSIKVHLPGLMSIDQSQAWTICVVIRHCAWFAFGKMMHLYLIIPPVIIVGAVTAAALLDACEGLPVAKQILRFIDFMRGISQLSHHGMESDGASNNLKLAAHRVEVHSKMEKTFEDDPLARKMRYISTSCFLCGLHQNQLGLRPTMASLGVIYSQLVLTTSLLLRMGNHFLRLVLACKRGVDARLRVVYGPDENSEANRQIRGIHLEAFYPTPKRSSSTANNDFFATST